MLRRTTPLAYSWLSCFTYYPGWHAKSEGYLMQAFPSHEPWVTEIRLLYEVYNTYREGHASLEYTTVL